MTMKRKLSSFASNIRHSRKNLASTKLRWGLRAAFVSVLTLYVTFWTWLNGANVSEKVGKEAETTTTIYSVARPDQSGAQVQDQLMAHAYAFAHNQTYGGACSVHQPKAKHQDVTQELLRSLDLDQFVTFACPPLRPLDHWLFWHKLKKTSNLLPGHKIIPSKIYRSNDTEIFTPAWLRFIRSHMKKQWIRKRTPYTLTVVVHIRRGGVKPCQTDRYMPNGHYRRVLSRYVLSPLKGQNNKPNVVIKIHSQKQSYEPWESAMWTEESDPKVSFQFHLDSHLNETWYDMMTADVLVMSRSSFSLVPAVLNFDAQAIIYTPFWHKPLPHWTIVSDDIMQESESELLELQSQCLQKDQAARQDKQHMQ